MAVSTFAQRLKICLQTYEKSRRAFSESTGFSYSTLTQWTLMEGDRVPSKQILEELCASFLGEGVVCDYQWLVSGKGGSPYLAKMNPNGVHLEEIELPRRQWLWMRRARDKFPPDGNVLLQLVSLQDSLMKQKISHKIMRVRDSIMSPSVLNGSYVVVGNEPFSSDDETLVCVAFKNDQRYLRFQRKINDKIVFASHQKGILPPGEVLETYPVLWTTHAKSEIVPGDKVRF